MHMGLIFCNIHGESGFIPLVSAELSSIISSNLFLDKNEIKVVEISFYDDESNEEINSIRYWMTKDAFDSLSAQSNYKIVTDEDEEKLDKLFDPVMKGGGCCIKCFGEYMREIGLKIE